MHAKDESALFIFVCVNVYVNLFTPLTKPNSCCFIIFFL